ncbi:MAG: glycosyltransferase [Nitrospirae bacterium]|nr:glycosyltransferase [Nitrospirota bacterium]
MEEISSGVIATYEEALALAERGRVGEALRLYDKVLIEGPGNNLLRAQVFNDLGVLSFSAGDIEKAEGLLKRAIFADPLLRSAHKNLTHINAGKFRDIRPHTFSIIIPTYNRCQDLQRCIRSIRDHSFYPVEIIVIGDPSGDGTTEYLRQEGLKSDTIAIINETHAGINKCINMGFSIAKGDYVCLLNDDVEVMPGWDLSVAVTIDDDGSAGAGVSLVVYPDGAPQSVGHHNSYWSEYHDWIGKVPFIDDSRVIGKSIAGFPEFQVPRECDYGFFPMMKRECFEKIGLVDEQFEHYCVDTDIGYRVQQAGYRNVYCPTSVIVHYELSKKSEKAHYLKFLSDLIRLGKKWGLHDVSRNSA